VILNVFVYFQGSE